MVGHPNEKAKQYYLEGADELIYIDAVASLYDRSSLVGLITDVVRDVFIPITVGGGIRSVNDVKGLLRAGADKVAINSAAVRSPDLISSVAQTFGSQCMVLSVEAKQVADNKWEVYTDGGREKTGMDVVEWVEEGIERGAGEILLTSVDCDGVERGLDIPLIQIVSELSRVPVIASGGTGLISHVTALFGETKADALAIGSALHHGRLNLESLRQELRRNGLGVRHYG